MGVPTETVVETATRAAVFATAATSEMANLAMVRTRTALAGKLTMLATAVMLALTLLAIVDVSEGISGGGSAPLAMAKLPWLRASVDKPVLSRDVGKHGASQPGWEIKSPRNRFLAIAAGVALLCVIVGCVSRCILARRAQYLEERVDTLLAAHNDALSAAHCEAFASDKVALGGQALFTVPPDKAAPTHSQPPKRLRTLSDMHGSRV